MNLTVFFGVFFALFGVATCVTGLALTANKPSPASDFIGGGCILIGIISLSASMGILI